MVKADATSESEQASARAKESEKDSEHKATASKSDAKAESSSTSDIPEKVKSKEAYIATNAEEEGVKQEDVPADTLFRSEYVYDPEAVAEVGLPPGPSEDPNTYAEAEYSQQMEPPVPKLKLQEEAKRINSELIKLMNSKGLQYYNAVAILRYALRIIGSQWVEERDKKKVAEDNKKGKKHADDDHGDK